MRVYAVDFDVNHYRQFSFTPEKRGELPKFWKPALFNGTPLRERWTTTGLWVHQPKLKRPGLWALMSSTGAFVAPPEVCTQFAVFFRMAGEQLPVRVEGESDTWKIINITQCVDCLNQSKCEWEIGVDGRRLYPTNFEFQRGSLPRSSLFKVPESPVDILAWEADCDPEREFKSACEHHKIKGVKFKLLWDCRS
jgi:hypothetical protein